MTSCLLIEDESIIPFEEFLYLINVNQEPESIATNIIPEHKLLTAILRQAIEDITEKNKSSKPALAWLNSPDDQPFTSIWILDHLQIRHAKILEALALLSTGRKIGPKCIYDRSG